MATVNSSLEIENFLLCRVDKLGPLKSYWNRPQRTQSWKTGRKMAPVDLPKLSQWKTKPEWNERKKPVDISSPVQRSMLVALQQHQCKQPWSAGAHVTPVGPVPNYFFFIVTDSFVSQPLNRGTWLAAFIDLLHPLGFDLIRDLYFMPALRFHWMNQWLITAPIKPIRHTSTKPITVEYWIQFHSF